MYRFEFIVTGQAFFGSWSSFLMFPETQDGAESDADSELVVQQEGVLDSCEVLQEGSPVLQQHSYKPGQLGQHRLVWSLISLRLLPAHYHRTLPPLSSVKWSHEEKESLMKTLIF